MYAHILTPLRLQTVIIFLHKTKYAFLNRLSGTAVLPPHTWHFLLLSSHALFPALSLISFPFFLTDFCLIFDLVFVVCGLPWLFVI